MAHMTFEQLLINMALDESMSNIKRDVNIDVPSNVDDEYDVEFPVKDRSTSRKHHASKMRTKIRRKMPNHHDSGKLYHAFDYLRGDLHKNLAVLERADIDEKEFADEPIAWIVSEATRELTLRDALPSWDLQMFYEHLNRLQSKGIIIDSSEISEIEYEFYRRERKVNIDREARIIAWEVLENDYPEDSHHGYYATEDEAIRMLDILSKKHPEYSYSYYIIPIKVYTFEQKQECKRLGYLPKPGFDEV